LYVDWRQGLFIHPSANRFVQLCEYKAGYTHEKQPKKLSKTKIYFQKIQKKLRLYSLNFATNLKSETITQNLLTVLKQGY
jgi:hypothetical protein